MDELTSSNVWLGLDSDVGGGGTQLWHRWDEVEDTIYYSGVFYEYMLTKFYEGYKHDDPWGLQFLYRGEADRTYVEHYAWFILYPYSVHASAPEGFCEDFVNERLDELEDEWNEENMEDLMLEIELLYGVFD